MGKQLHLRCAVCKVNTTVPGFNEQATLAHFLRQIPHKMDCYRNSIKIEEVNDNQSAHDRH